MINHTLVKNFSDRCILMCGQEAVALGLPQEAGYCIHEGILESQEFDWDETIFALWVQQLLETFGFNNEEKLLDLYGKCSDTMERYGNLMETLCV
jgi:hypothetical protein